MEKKEKVLSTRFKGSGEKKALFSVVFLTYYEAQKMICIIFVVGYLFFFCRIVLVISLEFF